MARYTRKQIVTCVSIVVILLLTALAGYAASRAEQLSLPIPKSLAYATTLLPAVSGLLLEAGYDLTRVQERRKRLPRGDTPRPPFVIVANTVIFIYSTVVITLLGTHAAPSPGLNCGLREKWTTMFSRKNVEKIRTIQQSFSCCGFQNSRDMAWPFPDKTHKVTACETTFGHTNGCLGAWKGEEQRIAGTLMAVVGLVVIWQFVIIAVPTDRESWIHNVIPDRVSRLIADEENGGNSGRATNFLPDFNRYSDRVQEEVSDDESESGARRTIEEGTQRAKNALTSGGDEEDEEDEAHAPHENEWLRN
ncbi:hypothetical protein P280DRAFT_470597 [Massarina eburnea CBS 473.64]|uniref:Tetraspanin Tsp3 n=1 Tax=Massarina eburnea CBS 473.64 TaxID=1395130 RepID=A0A6A6RUF0_9PLEO|nr:hypothetical protein P280DRAFT_470597 [Massarina eburnea CBS 473.64]